jgi:hypothetical protein
MKIASSMLMATLLLSSTAVAADPDDDDEKSARAAKRAREAQTAREARKEAQEAKAVGIYGGAVLGSGQPFGGQTVTGSASSTVAGGFGALVFAGYGFHPNMGVDGFFHYNGARRAFSDSIQPTPDSSGHVSLYGVSFRGMLRSGDLSGWASLGLAFGSAVVKSSVTLGTGTSGGTSTTVTSTDTVDIKGSPVLAFGAEYRVSSSFAIGPQARWYVTSYGQPCEDASSTASGAGTTTTATTNPCATGQRERTPDIVFLGVGLTFFEQ